MILQVKLCRWWQAYVVHPMLCGTVVTNIREGLVTILLTDCEKYIDIVSLKLTSIWVCIDVLLKRVRALYLGSECHWLLYRAWMFGRTISDKKLAITLNLLFCRGDRNRIQATYYTWHRIWAPWVGNSCMQISDTIFDFRHIVAIIEELGPNIWACGTNKIASPVFGLLFWWM